MAFDPIVSPTVSLGPAREPQFVHDADVAEAGRRLSAFRERRGGRAPERPRRAVRRRRLGRPRLLRRRRGRRGGHAQPGSARGIRPPPDLVLLRADVQPEPGVAAHRPAADAPRPPAAARCTASAGGLEDEVTLARLLSEAGYATQAVGKWHLGEDIGSQPQNVGFDDFYGFLSVSDMYTRVAGPALLPRDRLRRRPHRLGAEPAVQPLLRPRHERGRARERGGGDHPRAVAARRPLGDLLGGLHPPDGRRRPAVVPLPRHPRRPLRQLPVRALPRLVGRPSTRTATRSSSSTTSSGACWRRWRRAGSSRTR